MMKKVLSYLFLPIFLNIMLFNIMSFSVVAFADESGNVNVLKAHKAKGDITIDGMNDESSWELALWHPLDKLIMGSQPTKDDFNGKFKIVWNENQLFLLAEITDDILFDQHADPLYFYWDDDCLEIFIDEDASGGNHQFNYNAFAYHIALDNQVVDIGINNKDGSTNFVLLNDHIKSVWRRSSTKPNKIIWEVAINVFDDSFMLEPGTEKGNNKPVKLTLGKMLGFMLAYCDNDGSKERESFIGSANIKPVNGSKNLGYITADVFQQLLLIE